MRSTRYRVTFDGGSSGNPGPGYGSYQITRGDRDVLEQVTFDLGPITNNEAEYLTLIQALHRLRDNTRPEQRSEASVEIVGDSQLVLNQVFGTWSVNKSTLAALRDAARSLMEEFGDVSHRWVPRADIVAIFGH